VCNSGRYNFVTWDIFIRKHGKHLFFAYSMFISDYVYLLSLYNPCPDFDSFMVSKWQGFGGNKPE